MFIEPARSQNIGCLLAEAADSMGRSSNELTAVGVLRFRYMARLGKNAISVYEAPDMGLLDKKSIKLDGVQVPVPYGALHGLCRETLAQENGPLSAVQAVLPLWQWPAQSMLGCS